MDRSAAPAAANLPSLVPPVPARVRNERERPRRRRGRWKRVLGSVVPREETRLRDIGLSVRATKVTYARSNDRKVSPCVYGETISRPLTVFVFGRDLMGIRPAAWTRADFDEASDSSLVANFLPILLTFFPSFSGHSPSASLSLFARLRFQL